MYWSSSFLVLEYNPHENLRHLEIQRVLDPSTQLAPVIAARASTSTEKKTFKKNVIVLVAKTKCHSCQSQKFE